MTIKDRILSYQDELLKNLARLVKIPSIKEAPRPGAPFGKPIREAFDCFMEIAQSLGFEVVDEGGYALHATDRPGAPYIGILGHLDVVESLDPALWDSDPFTLTMKDGMMVGRGVNDDKGPLLACLYALKIVKDMQVPLKYPIRVIAGGDEESSWECVDHYFNHQPQPLMAFSPDGNFPIVNGEKGWMQFQAIFPKEGNPLRIICPTERNFVCDKVVVDILDEKLKKSFPNQMVFKGKKALSRNPQRGENALWDFVKTFKAYPLGSLSQVINYLDRYFVGDYYGQKAGIYNNDPQMGQTSICPMSLVDDGDYYRLNLDYRYNKSTDLDQVKKLLQDQLSAYGGHFEVVREKRLLYVEPDSKLIRSLQKAYEKVMNQPADLITKGGASYARALDCGVAFGATFEGEDPFPHMPNEHMPVDSLLRAMEIYVHAIIELAS